MKIFTTDEGNMAYEKIQHSKILYMTGEKEEAYKYIRKNKVNVMKDESLAFYHIEYCIDKGYYNEALDVKDDFLKKYPESKYVDSVNNLILDEKYNKKAKKYNYDKHDACFDICYYGSECCDCVDICVDFGKGDSGCFDIDCCWPCD